MTTFTSNNEAKKVAEQIAKTIQVFFTNEGLLFECSRFEFDVFLKLYHPTEFKIVTVH